MTLRILDISEEPTRLNVRFEQLQIRRSDDSIVSTPLAELAVVIAAHPQISISHAVLSGLAKHGGMFVACDEKRLPTAMFLPLQGHFLQSARFAKQAAAKLPLRKRLWQQIVRSKISSQAELLELRFDTDFGLRALLPLVQSGDPSNVEARAAARYWDRLFGDTGFRRDRDARDHNCALNYGYAVLRAITARAIVASGLHPCLGLHHHNQYNAFCLADDLMEPFRPLVDRVVAEEFTPSDDDSLMPTLKRKILETITGRVRFQDENRTLFDVLARVAQSLANVFTCNEKQLALPERIIHAEPIGV